MNHQELFAYMNENLPEDKRIRAILLSHVEAAKEILIKKGLVTEPEYNKHFDEILSRYLNIK